MVFCEEPNRHGASQTNMLRSVNPASAMRGRGTRLSLKAAYFDEISIPVRARAYSYRLNGITALHLRGASWPQNKRTVGRC